jgi:agmatinase
MNTEKFTSVDVPFGTGLVLFDEAEVVVFGVPFDGTATFGKGTVTGPSGIRKVASEQIEEYVIGLGNVYEMVKITDLGDLKFDLVDDYSFVEGVVKEIRSSGKVPLMLGGEHTMSYWALKGVVAEKPVVLHFDAHRDAKSEYLGKKMCHTTPIYHAFSEGVTDFIQIGIRQADSDEEKWAKDNNVVTLYGVDVEEKLEGFLSVVKENTSGRKVYVSFDIDALDIAYTPCTGTPEPFGLTPSQVVKIFDAINGEIIGIDMMEVAVRDGDYREATTAVQLLLRLLGKIA